MQDQNTEDTVSQIVEGLFRREAGRLVSSLTRVFGPARIDLAEDVVQDALGKALQRWPFSGIPDNPAAWIARVARNRALDILRGDRKLTVLEDADRVAHAPAPDLPDDYLFADDTLTMMFMCCHPELPLESQVPLVLKTLGGLSVPEIAFALRAREPAVAQRLTRARRILRQGGIAFTLPPTGELSRRLEAVLHVLYLLFTAGYSAHSGADLARPDLCEDAVYLTTLLIGHPLGDLPEVHALLALMKFQSSRLDARYHDGCLLLAEQRRECWDQAQIQEGLFHLAKARNGVRLTRYHLEAGIASCHAVTPSYTETDWQAVCELYDALLDLTESPIVALNRSVALAMLHGPATGIQELERLRDQPALAGYYLLHAALGILYSDMDDPVSARVCLQSALECSCSEPERRFLRARLAACASPERPAE